MNLTNETKKYIKFICMFIMFFIYPVFKYIPISLYDSINIDSKVTSIVLTIFAEIIFSGIILAVYFEDIKTQLKDFKKNFMKYMDSGFKYWIAGVGLMAVSNIVIKLFTTSTVANNEQSVQNIIESVPYLAFIMTTFLAPFIEEMIFRKAFKDVIHSKWAYILMSGLVFGGLHVVLSFKSLTDILYIIPYSSLGLAFAYSYYETKNIFTTIVYHMLHNGALTIISLIALGALL